MKKFRIILVLILIIVFSCLWGCVKEPQTQNGHMNIEEQKIKDNLESIDEINKEEISKSTEINDPPKDESSNQEDSIVGKAVEVTTTSLSNKTIAWGFRRMKDGVQPEFTASYAKVLDDYDGIYIGNKDEKAVYLTFDEGYENGYTGDILDTLKEKETCATFFVTKPYVKSNKELVQRMIDEGHIVGNHTVNHPSMPEVTNDEKLKSEITVLHDYMLDEFNYTMTFFRPPKGEYSERTTKIIKDLSYTTVLWSFAYDDWDVKNQKGTDYAKKMIYNNLHNGAVILLHAVSKDNTEVLGEVIDEIENRGYEILPLSEFK